MERAATLIGIAVSLLAKAGGEWPADERDEALVVLVIRIGHRREVYREP